jgi:DNA-binding transcriptional LysR family regulator
MSHRWYMTDLTRLRYFERVARLSSFTRAAEELNLAQPALSKQIAAIERELGEKVFERSGRSITLTQTGRLLLSHTDRILEEFKKLQVEMGDFVQLSRTELRIGATRTISEYVLPNVIKPFLQQHPNVDLLIDTKGSDELAQDLVEGRLDAAISVLPVFHPRLQDETLFTEEFVLAVPRAHRWASRDELRFSELRDVPVILPTVGRWYRDIVGPACKQHGFRLKPRVELASYETIARLVESGVGVALVPSIAVGRGTVGVRITHPVLRRSIGWIVRSGAVAPVALQEFHRLLADQLRAASSGQSDTAAD